MLIEVTGTFCVSNIRQLRKYYSISRRALARLIGMRPYLLKMIEEGRAEQIFGKSEIKRICEIFKVTQEELLSSDMFR